MIIRQLVALTDHLISKGDEASAIKAIALIYEISDFNEKNNAKTPCRGTYIADEDRGATEKPNNPLSHVFAMASLSP